MEIDLPEILEAVRGVVARYEQALVDNDLAVLDAMFWHDERVVRYGAGEVLHGIEAIRAFRRDRPATGLARSVERTVITTFGHDFATASLVFTRDGEPGRLGRQQQSWVRFDTGWRIVAAHVSVIVSTGVTEPSSAAPPAVL